MIDRTSRSVAFARHIGLLQDSDSDTATAPLAQSHATPILITEGNITGTSGNDFIHVAGDGLVAPSGYNDLAIATSGDDTIDVSQGGTDQVFAGDGNDTITAADGDKIDGGTGANTLNLDLGTVAAGVTLTFDSQSTAATTLADGTSFKNIQYFHLTTGAGNDTVTFNTPTEFADSNHFVIAGGPDSWDGGGGTNRAIIDMSFDGSTVNASIDANGNGGVSTFGGVGVLTLTNVQSFDITGGFGSDFITGGPNSDRIDGSGGDDRIQGEGTLGGAADTILGGDGNDVISFVGAGSTVDGGAGTDSFTADLSANSMPFTFTFNPGDAFTLTDGTSVSNVEILNLTTGAGNDNVTFNDNVWRAVGPTISGWDAGAGNDTVTLDYSQNSFVSMLNEGGSHVLVFDDQGELEGFLNVENYHITGAPGDDFLAVGSGHNIIDGAGGTNTLELTGKQSDYTVAYDAATQAYTITDLRAGTPDGITTAKNIAHFQFTDGLASYDVANLYPWASMISGPATTGPEADGTTRQTVVTDAGATWTNSYDSQNVHPWATQTASYDAGGHQLTLETNNDDGTHALTLFDAGNQYAWTQATISYDANWNVTGVSGTTDSGTGTVAMKDVETALDTALWYTKPYDPYQGMAVDQTLTAFEGYAYLYGGAGDDTLTTQSTNKAVLDGGKGDDTLNSVFDTLFVFNNGDGHDTITAFNDIFGSQIELRGYDVTNFTDLQALMTHVGNDTVITFDPENSITIQLSAPGNFTASDFVFT